MANEIIAVLYTSSSGNTYVTGINREVWTQLDGASNPIVGGTAYTGVPLSDAMPQNMRPRRVQVRNPAGKIRYVTVMTEAAALWSTSPPTVSLEDSDGVATVFTVRKKLGEEQRVRGKV